MNLEKENVMQYDHDSMVERDRFSRCALLVGSALVALFVPTLIGATIGSVVWSPYLFASAGFSFGVYLIVKYFHRFWVVVPQTAAFVTTNQFSSPGANPNIPYGPGGHPAYPWELRAESGNITLDILTVSFKETVSTSTTSVIVDGSVQFKFDLAHITQVVGIDVTTVEQGFVAQINEWLSQRLSGMTGEVAKNSVRPLREEIEREFEQTRKQMLLDEYGVRVTGFQISSIDFPPKVQETRDTIEESKRIAEGVRNLLGFKTKKAFEEARRSGAISESDVARARDDFLAASGNVKKEIKKLDITGIDGAAGAVVAGVAKIFGDKK